MEKFARVILIDDDDIDNFLNKNIIEEEKIAEEVTICKSGPDALALIQEVTVHARADQNPDLILLDINMPVMTGFQFLEKLQSMVGNSFFTVILSSSNNIIDIQEAAKNQVDYYIVKPLTNDKLRKMIERCFW